MSYPEYLNLNITALGRMAALKQAADKLNANQHRANPEKVYTWRDVRYSGFHNAATNGGTLSCGMAGGEPIYYTHCGQQFPREIFADEFIGEHGRPLIDHTGWFADADCSNTIRGLVVRLPHGRFMAGYYQSDNEERVYYPEIYDCEREAVYAADGRAESLAELEREYSGRWIAARNLEDELSGCLVRLRECIAMRNNPCLDYVREEIHELIERIRDIRESLKTEYADCV